LIYSRETDFKSFLSIKVYLEAILRAIYSRYRPVKAGPCRGTRSFLLQKVFKIEVPGDGISGMRPGQCVTMPYFLNLQQQY